MPGQLKPTAKCPHCGEGLLALVDESSVGGVRREYFHERRLPRARRRRCVKWFSEHEDAAAERQRLELPKLRGRRR